MSAAAKPRDLARAARGRPDYRKGFVSFVGFVLTVVAFALQQGDVIPAEALPWATLAVTAGTFYGVVSVPNRGAGTVPPP